MTESLVIAAILAICAVILWLRPQSISTLSGNPEENPELNWRAASRGRRTADDHGAGNTPPLHRRDRPHRGGRAMQKTEIMKIICIGRNYRDHIAEFDGGPLPAEPLFFLKPDTALLRNNDPFYIPDFTQEVHYECELVVRIDRLARHIAPRFAHRLYAEVGLGIDFTARDLQREAIANGWPWERAKGFDYSAAVAPQFVPVAELGDIRQLHFTLEINGEVRQRGYTGDMIFGVDELLSLVSRYITYRTGDLFFTGTPAGAGPVERGDVLRATLEGRELLNFEIR